MKAMATATTASVGNQPGNDVSSEFMVSSRLRGASILLREHHEKENRQVTRK
jgi:hypothetical protein